MQGQGSWGHVAFHWSQRCRVAGAAATPHSLGLPYGSSSGHAPATLAAYHFPALGAEATEELLQHATSCLHMYFSSIGAYCQLCATSPPQNSEGSECPETLGPEWLLCGAYDNEFEYILVLSRSALVYRAYWLTGLGLQHMFFSSAL